MLPYLGRYCTQCAITDWSKPCKKCPKIIKNHRFLTHFCQNHKQKFSTCVSVSYAFFWAFIQRFLTLKFVSFRMCTGFGQVSNSCTRLSMYISLIKPPKSGPKMTLVNTCVFYVFGGVLRMILHLFGLFRTCTGLKCQTPLIMVLNHRVWSGPGPVP